MTLGKFLVHGGAVDEQDKYVAPSVFDFGSDVAAFEKSEIMQGEVFGPVCLPLLQLQRRRGDDRVHQRLAEAACYVLLHRVGRENSYSRAHLVRSGGDKRR